MNVAIYCRVSTIEQVEHGYSIDEQQHKLKTFCEINDWSSYKMFVDSGFSGSNTKRPELQNLLNNIDKFDLVLVYKLDRLTRNVRDLLDLLDTFEQNNVSFRSATEVYDTSSAMGRLFVTLVGAMAEWERTTITERTVMGRKASLKNGNYVGKHPFYMDKVDGVLIPNDKVEVVNYIKDELLKGHSITSTVTKLNNSIYAPPVGHEWIVSTVKRIVSNPAICGHTKYGDELIRNTHEAVITEDEYKKIQQRISDRTNTIVQKHNAIFRGKLKCKRCGSKLYLKVRNQNNPNKKTTRRYVCSKCSKDKSSNQPPTFLEDIVENAFVDYIQKLDVNEYVKEKETNKKEKSNAIDIEKIKQQPAKYQRAWANGYISDSEFEDRMNETQHMMDLYYKSNDITEHEETVDVDKINHIKDRMKLLWEALSLEEKESFVGQFIEDIQYQVIPSKKPGSAKKKNTVVIDDVKFY